MNETMIENWNKVVKEGDRVYHLGDLAVGPGATAEYIKTLLPKLKGEILFVKGNHDKPSRLVAFPNYEIQREITIGKKLIVLAHFPMVTWSEAIHGSYHLFGHVHGTFKGLGRSMDVGVDVWNFTPVNYEEVKEKLEENRSNTNNLRRGAECHLSIRKN
jgi:calcineurin-like phosphoesterase family protein